MTYAAEATPPFYHGDVAMVDDSAGQNAAPA
jgi:hypothetical protein